ncbi:MAG: DUF5658 family protein [Planctomycetota bacterium]
MELPQDGRRERRAPGVDRRQRPTPLISRYSLYGGRRHHARRGDERETAYVDLYEPRLVLFLLTFFVLTVIDSVSTVAFLQIGGKEINPVAIWMLSKGPRFFVVLKGALTAVLIVFAMMHKNFRHSRYAIGIGFGFYFLLALYHWFLHWFT